MGLGFNVAGAFIQGVVLVLIIFGISRLGKVFSKSKKPARVKK
tara:strand:+ start:84 stop:212 length:129 start_codon:yes stop_codon:yes gene_type:complete